MRRRKLKRNKILNFNGIIVLFIFISLFFSVGYSLLVQDLTIGGAVNLAFNDTSDGISSDDLKFIYTKGGWYSNNLYYYQFDMSLENISASDVKDWKVIIDVPDDAQLINNWNNNMIIQDGKLIIYDGLINLGTTISFGCQITTSAADFDFGQIILNGEKVVINESQEYESENISIVINPTNSWRSGDAYFYQYDIVLSNEGDYNISSWQFNLLLPSNTKMDSSWNVNYVNKDNMIHFSNMDYNGSIVPGSSITFGAIFSSTDADINFKTSDITVN